MKPLNLRQSTQLEPAKVHPPHSYCYITIDRSHSRLQRTERLCAASLPAADLRRAGTDARLLCSLHARAGNGRTAARHWSATVLSAVAAGAAVAASRLLRIICCVLFVWVRKNELQSMACTIVFS